MKETIALAILAGVLLCGQNGHSVFASVPASAKTKHNPIVNDATAPLAGRKLFKQHCKQCHGEEGEGGRKAPPLINLEMQSATGGEIFWVITNGSIRRGMPSWSGLPELQRWQIVSYLCSLNSPGGSQ
jgi:mono/diheme cytochrome c family protein